MSPHEQALVHLQTLVSSCQGCGLAETRNKTAFSRGDGSSGLVVVGEAPGADEDEQGVPFVGSSGRSLDKMLVEAGIDPATVYVCNVVKCRPPKNRVPQVVEIAACSGYLFRQIQLVKPRVILTLGQTAGRTVLGSDKWPGMVEARGHWRRALNADVLPTFHPAYLFRVPSAKAAMGEDMRSVAERIAESLRK
jgi:DNA polymerase